MTWKNRSAFDAHVSEVGKMPTKKTQTLAEDAYKWQDVALAFGQTEQVVYSLPKCRVCGALVEACDREMHYDWHAALLDKGAK